MSVERDQNDGDPLWEIADRLIFKNTQGENTSEEARELDALKVLYSVFGKQGDLLEVWMQAKQGDDDALFSLLTSCKAYAGAKWVCDRVQAACNRDDWDFLQKYGKVLSESLKPDKRTLIQRTLYLVHNWNRDTNPLSGMQRLDIWRDLLEEKLVVGSKNPTRKELDRLDRYIERLHLKRNVPT